MTATEIRVAKVMGQFGLRLTEEQITPETAMAQDAYIDGIDVDDFAWAMDAEFGPVVREIPWLVFSDQRDSARGCLAVARVPFRLMWRWIMGKTVFSPPGTMAFPRLTVGHIAHVIDQGFWEEPADMNCYLRSPIPTA